MGHLHRLIAAFFLLASGAAHADTVLTFDDLTGTGAVGMYHGVDFGSDWRLSQSGVGSPFSAPNYIRPNAGPSTVAEFDMRLSTPTRFLGAYVGGWTGSSFVMNLYSGGSLVWTSDWLYFAADYSPAFYAAAYSGNVDMVGFYGRAGYWAVDNVTFASASAVPEPAGWAMLICGFATIGGGLRRRRAPVSRRAEQRAA